jgi:hypothetical protein
MKKNPALFGNYEIAGKTPYFLPSLAECVVCLLVQYTAPLVVKEGVFRGEGTIGSHSHSAE